MRIYEVRERGSNKQGRRFNSVKAAENYIHRCNFSATVQMVIVEVKKEAEVARSIYWAAKCGRIEAHNAELLAAVEMMYREMVALMKRGLVTDGMRAAEKLIEKPDYMK